MAKKLTHKEFIQKWESLVKNPGYIIVGRYINNRTPILVEDEYGQCIVNTGNLLKGSKPSIETAVDKTTYYKNKIKSIRGDEYCYDFVEYINDSVKIKIICNKHGIFEQNPHIHLMGQGCKECKRYSRLDSRRLTKEVFIEKAKDLHKNTYDYSKSEMCGSKCNTTITCREHGDFEQSPNSHLKGRGCPKCYLENNGYDRSKFTYFAKNNKCTLYLIKCYDKEESFLKIGITSKSVENRFSGDKKLPYNYDILHTMESEDAVFIWDLEVQFKKDFRSCKYTPKIKFKGYTECFKLEEKENIINYLTKIENDLLCN